MDGAPLYSDGKALYTSVQGDDGTWHVCRYETDGSGFRWLFNGRIVDSTEYGQFLYCMFPAKNGGECLGWYDTRRRAEDFPGKAYRISETTRGICILPGGRRMACMWTGSGRSTGRKCRI
jgi:hypothetical protein